MALLPTPGVYDKNGIPFSVLLNQNEHNTARESSNKLPYFQGTQSKVAGKATFAQGKNGAPNQSTLQACSNKASQSMGLNNGTNSTGSRANSGMPNSSLDVANTVGIHTNVAGTTSTDSNGEQTKKLKGNAKKRYQRLCKAGIPPEEARELCKLPWLTLENMLANKLQNRINCEASQDPPNKTPKTSTGMDQQNSLSSNDIRPLCVGITNTKPMNEDQMKSLHRHLVIAIKEQCSDGDGPEFLGFSHKTGWVLVTCVNQRSKEWLVNEVPYLEPWPSAQLSIIPVEELPKPPTAVTFIPESEAASVEEALQLFRVQNTGLNTELWKVHFEKVEKEGRIISFTLDHPSADALRAQDCQAAIGFKMVSFKIKGQYRPYTPLSATQNQFSATPNQSVMPGSSIPQGSQSLGHEASDQAMETTATYRDGPSSAIRSQLPQAANKGKAHANQLLGSFGNSLSSLQTIWKEPAALAPIGRSVPQTRGEFGPRPIAQNSQGHGRTPLIQPSLKGPVTGKEQTSARDLVPGATKGRTAQQIIQDSQSGRTPLTKGKSGVFGVDGSVLATRGISYQRVTSPPDYGGAPLDRMGAGAIYLDKYSSQAVTGGTHQDWSNSSSHERTARALTPGGFGAPPIIQNSPSGINLVNQGRSGNAGLTKSGQDGFSALALAREKLSQAGDPLGDRRTYDQKEMGASVTDGYVFSGSSQARSCYGARPIISHSQIERTMFSQERSGETVQTISHQGSALTTYHAPSGQVGAQITQATHGNNSFGQGRNEVDLTLTDSDESSPGRQSPEAEGGYQTWVIEDLEAYKTRLTQDETPTVTGTLNSATELLSPETGYGDQNWATQFRTSANRKMTSDSGLAPEGRNDYGAVSGTESHGSPFHVSRMVTDQEPRPGKGLLPHPSGTFDSQNKPEGHGNFQGSRGTLTDGESRSRRGLLPHPREGRRSPLDAIKGTVTDRGTRSDRRLSPQARDSDRGRIQDPKALGRLSQGSKRTWTERRSRSPSGRLPHPREGRRSPLDAGRRTVADRGTRSDRRLSPQARDSDRGRIQDPKALGRPSQGSKRTWTDRESRSPRGRLPHPREGRRSPLDASRRTVTDRGTGSDRRLSPQARDSDGSRKTMKPLEDRPRVVRGHGPIESQGHLGDGCLIKGKDVEVRWKPVGGQ